ncbi:E3 ubiquitin-protein ligase RNF4 isoform X2 [Genypterus blacodes]|uniref:E3 ubiquitin-protein ligase RNF4 isoform X2 n=2 Tax=Genypterus blacodes TaxID=154954 RepID=UPI003F762D74
MLLHPLNGKPTGSLRRRQGRAATRKTQHRDGGVWLGFSAMSSAAPRKRRTAASPLVRPPTKTSRAAYVSRTANASRTSRAARSDPSPAPRTETIAVMDATQSSEEVVDLTSEAAELPAVVDLTNNDSVVLVDEGPQNRRETGSESYVVSSDEDDVPIVHDATLLSSLQANRPSRTTPGTISCPVCMDSYTEIVDSGRLVVSTKCGHIFCSQCLKDSLNAARSCPTCRSKLTHRQYHPIYI